MHDALAAERRGIPAAAVMTDRFVTTADAVIELNGLPSYPYVVIAHPIASDSGGEQLQRRLREDAHVRLAVAVSRLQRDGALHGSCDGEACVTGRVAVAIA